MPVAPEHTTVEPRWSVLRHIWPAFLF